MSSTNTEILTKFENIDHLSQYLNNIINNLSNETLESQDQDLEKTIKNYFRQRATDETHPLPAELPNHIQKALETSFKIHQSTITNTLMKEKLSNKGQNLVEQYDWKLRWVLGTSKLANQRVPLCQLELYCSKNLINFECTFEQVEELINVLNNVKKEIK
ncbi:unnamed protein product [Ceutorhynchus assimilis]|uniref:COMM domain-containing protein n=1 Tax=Ceutorhynchus assimilis TaxID=467358 RepID=A0A9N9QS39_9CUCU|nr:unnamed protein product [Ceutorhynchus assimilis]